MATVFVSDCFLNGNLIRRARKDHRCDGWTAKPGHAVIKAGDYYVEGDCNDEAGGYGNDRYCLACVPEAAKQVPAT